MNIFSSFVFVPIFVRVVLTVFIQMVQKVRHFFIGENLFPCQHLRRALDARDRADAGEAHPLPRQFWQRGPHLHRRHQAVHRRRDAREKRTHDDAGGARRVGGRAAAARTLAQTE